MTIQIAFNFNLSNRPKLVWKLYIKFWHREKWGTQKMSLKCSIFDKLYCNSSIKRSIFRNWTTTTICITNGVLYTIMTYKSSYLLYESWNWRHLYYYVQSTSWSIFEPALSWPVCGVVSIHPAVNISAYFVFCGFVCQQLLKN